MCIDNVSTRLLQVVSRHDDSAHESKEKKKSETSNQDNTHGPTDFLSCRHCDFVSNDVDVFWEHFRKEHDVSVFVPRDDIVPGVHHKLSEYAQFRCAEAVCASTSQCNDLALVSNTLCARRVTIFCCYSHYFSPINVMSTTRYVRKTLIVFINEELDQR